MKINRFIVTLAAAGLMLSCTGRGSYADRVNTLIGNGGTGLNSTFLYPGATYPFGMVQFTPTFGEPHTGFTSIQLSGVGCYSLGQFRMLPQNGPLEKSPNHLCNWKQNITEQKGHAGWYSCLADGAIRTQLSVTPRTGMALMEPADSVSEITVLLGTGFENTNVGFGGGEGRITEDGHFECHATALDFCSYTPTPFDIWYYAEFDREAETGGAWLEDVLLPGQTEIEGKDGGIYLTFKGGKPLKYKFAMSFVSLENAKENLRAENPGWDFKKVRRDCEKAWDKYLSMVDVKGRNPERTEQFYTHLYHALIHPSLASDVNGEYMGSDFKVHKVEEGRNHYHMFSNWDTYRTQCQLVAMLAPDVASDIVVSHERFAEQCGGGLPRWSMANYETNVMQGNPGAALCASMWAFGARDYDPEPLAKVIWRAAETPGLMNQVREAMPDLQCYLEKGYAHSPSLTLEYAVADNAIAEFSRSALGNEAKYQEYRKRSECWRNIFNPDGRWIQGRSDDGSWMEFRNPPYQWQEASHKIYHWMIPHDIEALVEATGGNEAATARLDSLFVRLDDLYDGDYFAACNEPGFGVPWTYDFTGHPEKTCEVVNRILTEVYSTGMDGVPGNDDLGAMGSWYTFACLGLYPYIPGKGGFALHTPIFEKVVLHLPGGDLTLLGGCESQDYSSDITLNGKKVEGSWIDWDDVKDGGILKWNRK